MTTGRRVRFSLDRQSKRYAPEVKRLGKIRPWLEAAVEERYGEVSPYHALIINSVLRHELRCRLANRWLAEHDDLKIADRLAILSQIGAATEARDRALKSLGIDRRSSPADLLASILDGHSSPGLDSGESESSTGDSSIVAGGTEGPADTAEPSGTEEPNANATDQAPATELFSQPSRDAGPAGSVAAATGSSPGKERPKQP